MIPGRELSLVMLWSLSGLSPAQVSSSEPSVAIVPRSRPESLVHGERTPRADLRVDTSLVLVPVHAATPVGASITDLIEENFQLFEDGIEQKVSYFSTEDAPLSVGLVFDSSGSMSNKIRKSAEAAAAFFKTANADDEFFLVEFGDRPKLVVPFTPDSDQIYKTLIHSRPFGRTSLMDAIHLALQQMRKARNPRKAMVILSDGGDNRSRFTRAEIKDALLESDVQAYAIGIFDRDEKHTIEEQKGPGLLEEIALHTGGLVYPVDDLKNLAVISAALGTALRSQYLLGYAPSNPLRDGKYRNISVRLLPSSGRPDASVSYRRGYYAPTQ